MTGPNEPPVANIPDHLDEYPEIVLDWGDYRWVCNRGVEGQWYCHRDGGAIIYTVDELFDRLAK